MTDFNPETDKFKMTLEDGVHVIYENVDHLNSDGTLEMTSRIVASIYDLEHAGNILEMLNEKGVTVGALATALTARDETKTCPFCSKVEWGEELHEEDCPFAISYKILNDQEKEN